MKEVWKSLLGNDHQISYLVQLTIVDIYLKYSKSLSHALENVLTDPLIE